MWSSFTKHNAHTVGMASAVEFSICMQSGDGVSSTMTSFAADGVLHRAGWDFAIKGRTLLTGTFVCEFVARGKRFGAGLSAPIVDLSCSSRALSRSITLLWKASCLFSMGLEERHKSSYRIEADIRAP